MPDSTEKTPRGIRWHDLTEMRLTDTIRELLHPLPWLFASWALFASPFWMIGFLASFMFFLCGLRLNHEAIHGNLGLTRNQDNLVMHMLSFLMGASNHAVCHGHLVHHKHNLGPGDFEGKCGHMTFFQVLRYGPRFPFDINREAWMKGNARLRRRIVIDLGLNGVLVVLTLWTGWTFLILHVVAIAIAQCLTALFAVWITHQGTQDAGVIARSQRGILARLAYLMFYHREHHLYPKVPVHRLPKLASRLDHEVPGYAGARLPVVPILDRKHQDNARGICRETMERSRLMLATTENVPPTLHTNGTG